MLTLLGPASRPSAQESIYTWTDENGVVHISNRKPNRDVKVQDVERYGAPPGGSREQKPKISKDSAEPPESRAQIERYEKAAREAAGEAQKAAKFAEEARKAADEFREKIGNNQKRWRRNRSRIKKLDEQAKIAAEKASAAAENARAAREAADVLRREPPVEVDEKDRPSH